MNFSKVFKSVDMFGADSPGLNFNGRSSIKTFTGAISSIVVISVTFLFALLKLQFLLLRKQPDIVEFIDKEFFDNS